VTLRMRGSGPLSLPPVPNTGAGGRVLDSAPLGAGEGRATKITEYTVWLQDKCSRAPCGAFGEVCDVPGLGKPVLLIISDDDAPRAIRVAVCMASLPFTILFQVVLLEVSEVSAVVQSSSRVSASRRALNQVFVRYFGGRTPTSGILSQMASQQVTHGERALGDEKEEVRRKLDELTPAEDVTKKLGVEYGDGAGGPGTAREGETESSVIHMTTRKKLGRLMVFSLHRDEVGPNLYLRVVMHDPVSHKEAHLTILSYTAQRFLDHLRISRGMIDQNREELGKLVVDNVYLVRPSADGDERHAETLDNTEVPDDEDVYYEIRLRDIIDNTSSALLSSKQRLLDTAFRVLDPSPPPGSADTKRGSYRKRMENLVAPGGGEMAPEATLKPREPKPKNLLDVSEEALVLKCEKTVNGRRLLIAFYRETTKEDMIQYSHNVRVQVADAQTLEVLCGEDLHEDTIEPLMARRNKRHLLSATRETELVTELGDMLNLQYMGQEITGITFNG